MITQQYLQETYYLDWDNVHCPFVNRETEVRKVTSGKQTNIKGKGYSTHILVWMYLHNEWLHGDDLIRLDGDWKNNHPSNLDKVYKYDEFTPTNVKEIFDYDPADPACPLVLKHSLHKRQIKGSRIGHTDHGTKYVYFPKQGTNLKHRLHRIVWCWHNGCWPGQDPSELYDNNKTLIDHLDHNGHNNTIENLQLATHLSNSRNRRLNPNNKSGHHGVYQSRNKNKRWVAMGYGFVDGKRTSEYLGTFDTIEQAVDVRKQWERDNNYHPNHGKDS